MSDPWNDPNSEEDSFVICDPAPAAAAHAAQNLRHNANRESRSVIAPVSSSGSSSSQLLQLPRGATAARSSTPLSSAASVTPRPSSPDESEASGSLSPVSIETKEGHHEASSVVGSSGASVQPAGSVQPANHAAAACSLSLATHLAGLGNHNQSNSSIASSIFSPFSPGAAHEGIERMPKLATVPQAAIAGHQTALPAFPPASAAAAAAAAAASSSSSSSSSSSCGACSPPPIPTSGFTCVRCQEGLRPLDPSDTEEDRRPRALVGCTHSLCGPCAAQHAESDQPFKCPLDQLVTPPGAELEINEAAVTALRKLTEIEEFHARAGRTAKSAAGTTTPAGTSPHTPAFTSSSRFGFASASGSASSFLIPEDAPADGEEYCDECECKADFYCTRCEANVCLTHAQTKLQQKHREQQLLLPISEKYICRGTSVPGIQLCKRHMLPELLFCCFCNIACCQTCSLHSPEHREHSSQVITIAEALDSQKNKIKQAIQQCKTEYILRQEEERITQAQQGMKSDMPKSRTINSLLADSLHFCFLGPSYWFLPARLYYPH
jgi:hypothetical protein